MGGPGGEGLLLETPLADPMRKQQGRRNINAAVDTEEQMREPPGDRVEGPTGPAASSPCTD